MKKLTLLFSTILFCFSCQKAELKSESDNIVSSNAVVTRYDVGVINSGTYPNGTAFIGHIGSVLGSTKAKVKPGDEVNIMSFPKNGYVIDYWWQYSAEPTSLEIVPRANNDNPIRELKKQVHEGEQSFTYIASEHAWFEPIFRVDTGVCKLNFFIPTPYKEYGKGVFYYNGNTCSSLVLSPGKEVTARAIVIDTRNMVFYQWRKYTVKPTDENFDSIPYTTIQLYNTDLTFTTTQDEIWFMPEFELRPHLTD